MIAQECIAYDNYARCWVIGRREVRVSGYDYHKPRAERYRVDHLLSHYVEARSTRPEWSNVCSGSRTGERCGCSARSPPKTHCQAGR